MKTDQGVDQRGFSGAVRPQQSDGPAGKRAVEIFENLTSAQAHSQSVQMNYRPVGAGRIIRQGWSGSSHLLSYRGILWARDVFQDDGQRQAVDVESEEAAVGGHHDAIPLAVGVDETGGAVGGQRIDGSPLSRTQRVGVLQLIGDG